MKKSKDAEEWGHHFHQSQNNLFVHNENLQNNEKALSTSTRPVFDIPELDSLSEVTNLPQKEVQKKDAPNRVSAAYTYFGQFIAHDMVHFSNSHDLPNEVYNSNRCAVNQVNNPLQLETLYLSKLGPDKKSGFFLDSKNEKVATDIPRDVNGKPLINDVRNDQNLLISQFCLLWMKYHNHLVETEKLKWKQARDRVCKTFHVLVKYDFLKTILMPDVWELFFANRQPVPGIKLHTEFNKDQIPPPFHAAAFRIGHGMVRASYKTRNVNGAAKLVSLEKLFARTNQRVPLRDDEPLRNMRIISNEPLSEEWQVDWSFFERNNKALVPSGNMRIDIPHIGCDEVSLLKQNLMRAHDFGVADAQTYIDRYKALNIDEVNTLFDPLPDDNNFFFGQLPNHIPQIPEEHIRTLKISTPLWYYIQREAAHLYSTQGKEPWKIGLLGPLGSLIVGQVFHQFLSNVRETDSEINTLSRLFEIVK